MKKVGKLEFKLNMYFEMYKDKSFHNAKEFKTYFINKHGEFPYLSELYMMMDKYQIKKYGQSLVYTYDPFLTKEERLRISQSNIQREYHRRKNGNKKHRTKKDT